MKRHIGLALAVLAAAMALTTTSALSSNGDDSWNQFYAAMESGNFQQAEAIARRLTKEDDWPTHWSMLGDALFMQGKAEAHDAYLKAWKIEVDWAWNKTKGDSPAWKLLAGGMAVLGMATDIENAKQGVDSNYTRQGFAAASRLSSSLESATGDPGYRKRIASLRRDLRRLTRRSGTSFPAVKPNHNMAMGVGIARVHMAGGICEGLRLTRVVYVALEECIAGNGDIVGISLETALEFGEFEPAYRHLVASGPAAAAFGPGSGLALLSLQEGKNSEVRADWRARRIAEADHALRLGVTWHAVELEYVVPLGVTCAPPDFGACAVPPGQTGVAWVQTPIGWFAHGLLDKNGVVHPIKL